MWEGVISGFIGGCFAGFIGGSFLGWFSGWQYSAKIIELDRKINQIWGSFNSQKGVDGKAQQSQEMQAMMTQALLIWKGEGTQQEKMAKLVELAASNPAMASKLLKQVGVGL